MMNRKASMEINLFSIEDDQCDFAQKSKENLLSSFDGWPNQRNTRTQHWSSGLKEFSASRVESKKAAMLHTCQNHSRPSSCAKKSQSLIKGHGPFLTPTHFPISYQLHVIFTLFFDW